MPIYRKLKGTGVAMVTPFHKDGAIDFKALERLIESLIAGKADYLVLLGTTGESVTLNKDEKTALLDYTKEVNNGRLPLVLGVGGNNTQEVVSSFKTYDFENVDAVLSVTPYYNRPSQKGLQQHFKMIAHASPLPVILYNVPARTGTNITAETTLSLANEFENIAGIKEASGNFEQITRIIKDRPNNFLVISGDDNITYPLMALGADGVISVAANAFPRDFANMVRFCLKGEYDKACRLHYQFMDILPLLYAEGSPGGIKAALNALKICSEHVRLPLAAVSKTLQNKIAEVIAEKFEVVG
ncbi:MAG TPA: 4-hydroxy-tetrahydrodipicolinate synthase [Bacteroidia bacterium]|nr:4-hydroxy-tetrahydrodipicolinate synthase [Bacteroidia bacterium]